MPKQKIEIDVPEGWEVVGSGIIGRVLDGTKEHWGEASFVLRRTWQWPTWIKARYLVPRYSDRWYAANSTASLDDCCCVYESKVFDFTPPPERRVYENPNWGKE